MSENYDTISAVGSDPREVRVDVHMIKNLFGVPEADALRAHL
jgi:hypothetical protein